MDRSTPANGKRIESTVVAPTPGMMEGSMKETGRTTTWMGLVSTPGRTEGSTKVNTRKTRSTGKVCTHGLMAVSMMGSGRMEGNTVEENTYLKPDSSEKASGKTVKESDGLMTENNNEKQ
jgi:hypothetical protein